jgi:hypothetical protein
MALMAHEDALEEHVEEGPEPARGGRRLLIIVLSVGCLALAVSNVLLAVRVTELRRALVAARATTSSATMAARPATAPTADIESATSAAGAERPAVVSAPTPERTPSGEPSVTDDAAASITSPAASSAAHEPMPAPARAAEVPPSAPPELPPRTRGREQARVPAATRAGPEREAAAPSSPERATASWMVHEYGRADAESRARAVANFYGPHSPDGAYWRRVLAEIARR